MIYDIEFSMPVSFNVKYATRLTEFKKTGLQHINDHKVLLTLLVGTEDIPNILEGWPPNVDVRIFKSDENHHAAKVYGYYSNLTKLNTDNLKTKWFMRIDDDSMTNVSVMMSKLNKLNPYENHYYFIGGYTEGDISVERKLIGEMQLDIHFPLIHEIESSIISNKSMYSLLSNDTVKELFYKRSKIELGFTDICFAVGAELIGIYPTFVNWFTNESNIFGFLTNNVFHIHWIAPDVNSVKFDIISNAAKSQHLAFLEKDIVFGTKSNNVEYICNLFMKKNGLVISHPLNEVYFWNYDEANSKLILYLSDLKVAFIYMIPPEYPIKYSENGVYFKNEEKTVFIRSLI